MRKSSRLSPLSAVQKCVRARARVLSARGNLLLFIYFTIILFAHDHRRRRYIPLNDRSTRTVSAHGRVAVY